LSLIERQFRLAVGDADLGASCTESGVFLAGAPGRTRGVMVTVTRIR
jgi:hypothetical protein